jgi:acyl-CoA oxidase
MALAEERKANRLDMEALTTFIYKYACSNTPLQKIREIREKVRKIPEMNLSLDRYFDTREDGIYRTLRFGQRWHQFFTENRLNEEETKIAFENFLELSGYLTQVTFFYPSLEIQADDEQLKEWRPKIKSLEIIGCYAQTELGHGSNVKGIEIEASYDHATQSFVLNSPSASATKWWIGGLGLTSNHALVIAQLIINGQRYGPHAFLVPIRDTRTHEPFLGVDVGDIGPKIGLHVNDNGYLRFSDYRISKKYMLSRFSRINEKGEYEVLDPNSLKVLYMSVVRARLGLIIDAWMSMSVALTIAIRYSLVRQQFPDPENDLKEVKLLDYQIQQFKVFVPLSRLYAFVFARTSIIDLYLQIEEQTKKGKSPSMDLMHCITCIYKVFISAKGIEAIETLRRSCGGHGYMMASGIPSLYAEYLPKVTYDGENTVLGLQAIKYLVSLFHKRPPKEFAYLVSSSPPVSSSSLGGFTNASFHQQCFELIARGRLLKVVKKFNELKTRISKDKIWADYLQVEGVETLEPIFHSHVHQQFTKAVSEMPAGANREAVEHLRRVYVGSEIEKFSGDLLVAGVSAEDLDNIKAMMVESLSVVRVDALGLIEAFERNDESLNSILGRSDGDIYTNMLKYARESNPVNKSRVFPGITELLRPKL